jgi:hypothetical protein
MCEISTFKGILLISAISVIFWNLITKNYGLAFFRAWATSLIGLIVRDAICDGSSAWMWLFGIVIWMIPQLIIVAIINIPFFMFRYRQEQKKSQNET